MTDDLWDRYLNYENIRPHSLRSKKQNLVLCLRFKQTIPPLKNLCYNLSATKSHLWEAAPLLDVRIKKRYGDFSLNVEVLLPETGITVFFGDSGAGKSTLMGVISGLVRPDEGHVSRDGCVFYDSANGIFVPPEKRNVGCVFQQHRLFSHMSVKNNLLFAMRFCGKSFDEETFEKVVTLLGISHLLKRRPNTLSGGESQRVAIGRAILSRSSLLLMDEPMSSLDRGRKEEIFEYISMIPGQFGTPVIYVTHSAEELTALADTVLVVENGSAGALMGREEFMSNYIENGRKGYAKYGGGNIG